MRLRPGILLCLVSIVLLAAQPPPSPQLAHIAGSSRKIRMYVKNAYLRLGADGQVSGVQDDTSPETVLQRSSVTVGRVKIQGVTTCMYLCMDACGQPYASKEFYDECVFNEMIEENHYNSYSSAKYSNPRRTLYLGLNKQGKARRVISRGGVLGPKSTYARVLTQSVFDPPRNASCPHSGPPSSRPPTRCRRLRLRRPRRRKRKRCREGEEMCRKRKSRLEVGRRIRHRNHRTVSSLEEEEDEDEEDVTMTTEDEEDHTDMFIDSSE